MNPDALKQELHGGMDDTGEYACKRKVRLAAVPKPDLADEQRARVIRESDEHFMREGLSQWSSHRSLPECRGESCRQGRLPCRERCGAEMAVPDDDKPLPWWTPHGLVAGTVVLGIIAAVLWILAYPPGLFK